MARTLTIGSHTISDDSPAYVIAEIGHNHQGSVDLCKQLIRAAAKCGASAVKLQKRHNRTLYTKAAFDAPYHGDNAFGRTYGEHREALEFGTLDYADLQGYSGLQSVHFLSTAFDHESADLLAELAVPAIKMASGDITNTPLLGHVASLGIPMIVSTGTANLTDVDRAANVIGRHHQNFALLQCTAEYPVPADHLNLRVIETYRECFPGTVVGLSYHDCRPLPAVLAYALGARIIEAHFTLSHAMRGSDHLFSMEPLQLLDLVENLKASRGQLGTGEKHRLPGEEAAIQKMGKSVVLRTPPAEGQPLTIDHLECRSPGGGIPPYRMGELVGRVLPAGVAPGQAIPLDVLAHAQST